MNLSEILKNPLTLLLYGIALCFWLWGRFGHAAKGYLFSTAVAIAATALALLQGVSMWQAAAALIVFLLLNMGGYS